MTRYLIIIFILITGCDRKHNEAIITIVDIGHLDRNGIARELNIINKYSPKVIGLAFMLSTDSLGKDLVLSETLSKPKNLIEGSLLHENQVDAPANWDSLEMYHQKFRFGDHGFLNVSTDGDSTFINELPMRQYYHRQQVDAFSSRVAKAFNSALIDARYMKDAKDITFNGNEFGHYFKIISVKELLAETFAKQDLTGKIVLMGALDEGEWPLYLDKQKTEKISRVEIQASLINAILN